MITVIILFSEHVEVGEDCFHFFGQLFSVVILHNL